jgi:hypothetical protein
MRRKLELFGHISRMDNKRMIKSVLMGTVEGATKRGRPCTEWLEDVRDWCRKDVHCTVPEVLGTRQGKLEGDGKVFSGHLWAVCPWNITMMMMNPSIMSFWLVGIY